MEELKELLENVSDTYYDFVRGMLADAEENIDRLDEIIAYIKDNPEATTSDILGWTLETLYGFDLDNVESIVVDDDEVDEEE